uniref:Bardet-Biedl syndrome 2 protein homolog n=1 Tax=Pyramimonas obovata TaxID=1411642 RepID=A0A7S0QX50_9CHLO|mmetsp:Transcript_160/g.406  ORF Transcript_160/g.406 Transcript_160/m.406 type:complete len:709 (+) Transcript_160:237-2363(+)|eukprot:CAMPEP_0118930748 /NCGR_PEP_ID=MMETSP1169-20130426/7329_1 /TAXON_ID=36882 /ORGANISM="Pyramimonas obovata, Strain CCMP722" /LENGTH=708 /DNA_ID=CAMNT_0006873151 /DNA_START=234 /DNA_END=2360 /DNA_ORIENTATION=-
MVLIPTFQLHLADRIHPRQACIGKYDGKHPSLTCATSGSKIFIHSPHNIDDTDVKLKSGVRYLNINKTITSLDAAALVDPEGPELLLIGTASDLLAYDVEGNKDHFFKEVADGVNVITHGSIPMVDVPVVVVGGNCSIQGYDAEGNEPFWTVTGDNVSAMIFADVDEDGSTELLVGSEDYAIRIFKNEEVMHETMEADKVIDLCEIHNSLYGYALGNGTVGIYDRATRVWRVKSKHAVTCVQGFDLDADGVPEIVSGWANGKIEVRTDRSGDVLYRDTFPSAVSAVLRADYRCDGREEMIACSLDGEVRGYLPPDVDARGTMMDSNTEEESIAELSQRKQELLYELQSYEKNMALASKQAKGAGDDTGQVVPAGTKLTTVLDVNLQRQCCELVLSTNNECVIKGAVVFAEQLFEGESLFHYEKAPEKKCRVPLSLKKDIAANMLIKAMVGSRTSNVYHVFEVDYTLPKFAMYVPVERREAPEPASSVTFHLNERANRVQLWLEGAFTMPKGADPERISLSFVSLRDGKSLWIDMTSDNGGTFAIKTEDMEAAGEMVQDLCGFLGVTELESIAEFPYEMETFRSVLMQVDEYNAVRLKLTAEMADSSNLVKTLVIKAEDARILNNMGLMHKMYQNLFNLNRELIMEHTKRSTNHQELLAALKEVNQMIQKAARLRVGTPKTRVVAACRNAIKTNNIHSLFKIMKMGDTA